MRYAEFRAISDSHSIRGSLTTKMLADMEIIVPPKKLLDIFNQFSTPIVHKIELNLKQNIVLSQIRDTLLPKLISGEIQLQNPKKFVEAVS